MRPFSNSIISLLLTTLFSLMAPHARAADFPGPQEKQAPCPQCSGTGAVKCTKNHCQDGKADCPGTCLNLNRGIWEKMDVKGHASIRVWQKFKKANGGFTAWNDHHLGEVVTYVNGDPVLTGKCTVCGGTSQVTCTSCKGTGQATCSLCQGRKTVLESQLNRTPAPASTPSPISQAAPGEPAKAAKSQTRFELNDGRVLVGRKAMVIGNSVTIRTDKGNVEVNSKDILKEEPQPGAK